MNRTKILWILLITFLMVACKNDEDQPSDLTLTEESKAELEYGGWLAPSVSDLTVSFRSSSDWQADIRCEKDERGVTDWCRLQQHEGTASDRATLTLTTQENTTMGSRYAYVTIRNAATQMTVKVTQEAKDLLQAEYPHYSVPAAGGLLEIKIRYNYYYEWVYDRPETELWISRVTTDTKAVHDEVIRFNVTANTTGERRTASILFRNRRHDTSEVQVYQEAF